MKQTILISLVNVFLFIGCNKPSAVDNTQNFPAGALFIIGGGNRDAALMAELMSVSNYKQGDIIAVVTMASGWGDSAYIWLNDEFKTLAHTTNNCLKIDSSTVKNPDVVDSLLLAKIIFLSGGDQNVLMKHIQGTRFKERIHEAFENGATVAGTSAGAALMSEKMITGNQLTDTAYTSQIPILWTNNIEVKEGLGLLDSVIIDQHFVVRSRYNRLLSALHNYPAYQCIGIDEASALIVKNGVGKVVGESQVITFSNGGQVSENGSYISTDTILMHIYTEGEMFPVKQ
jgi:cyanophycinase